VAGEENIFDHYSCHFGNVRLQRTGHPNKLFAKYLLRGRRTTTSTGVASTTATTEAASVLPATRCTTRSATAVGAGDRAIATLFAGLDRDPCLDAVTTIDADATLATGVHGKRRSNRALCSVESVEFKEGARLGAHDLELLDRTEARSEHLRELRLRDILDHALCVSSASYSAGQCRKLGLP
jgi:hypothetical protein